MVDVVFYVVFEKFGVFGDNFDYLKFVSKLIVGFFYIGVVIVYF